MQSLQTPCHPQQIEFARLNLTYTVLSKRKLLQLVEGGHVSSWNDPRMPTISGFRRRGYPAKAIVDFCQRIGVSKNDSWIDVGLLEHCVREELNEAAIRRMAVLRPLKVIIDNYPVDQQEELTLSNHPLKPELGTRTIHFSQELYIEEDDFMENPIKGYHRLAPGAEVRLRGAYFIRCVSVDKNPDGSILAVHCTYDPQTKSGSNPPDGRKVKGTIHWLPSNSPRVTVRLYDRLFQTEFPGKQGDFLDDLNPHSVDNLVNCLVEPCALQESLAMQWERTGYFIKDNIDSTAEKPVYNRIVSLKDSWAKLQGH